MSNTPLLFVNKTPSSALVSKSDPSEAAAILRHVQRKRRRAESSRRANAQPWAADLTLVVSPTFNDRRPDPDAFRKNQQKECRQISFSHVYPSSNAFDPFHCTVAGLDAGSHALLRHTLSSVSRTNFLAESFSPSPKEHAQNSRIPSRHALIFEARLLRCITDEALMYATLAYSCSLLGWMTGSFEHSHPPEYFLSKAISAVRNRIDQRKQRIDDWLLLSMYSLAVVEFWSGIPKMWSSNAERCAMAEAQSEKCLATCRAHLKVLLNLVNAAGGWGCFDQYVLDSVLLTDKYLAIVSMQPCTVPLSWDPGPWDPSPGRNAISHHTYPRLAMKLLAEAISPALAAIIRDIADYCRTACDIWTNGASMSANTESWLFRRLQALMYRLINHHHGLSATTSHLDHCVSLASLLFLFVSVDSKGPSLGAMNLATVLRQLLLSEDTGGTRISEGLRFWCISMGALVPEPFEQRLWFIHQLALGRKGYIRPDEFAMKLGPYLFLPDRHESLINKVAYSLFTHRSK